MRQPWERVADALRQAIAAREYGAGQRIPSEHDLVARFGVSRVTVRRALLQLRSEGLVVSSQGRGTFVRDRLPIQITRTAAAYHRHRQGGQAGFSAQVREQGHTPSQEVLEVARVPAPPEIAERLGVDAGDELVVRRLRALVDGEPVQQVDCYYRPDLVADSKITQPVKIRGGVHSELERLGVSFTLFVEEVASARMPTPDEKRDLRLPDGVPVIRSLRTAYAGEDNPVEVLDTISHGEAFSYRYEIPLVSG